MAKIIPTKSNAITTTLTKITTKIAKKESKEMIKLLTPNLLEVKNSMNSWKLWLISSNLRPKNQRKNYVLGKNFPHEKS